MLPFGILGLCGGLRRAAVLARVALLSVLTLACLSSLARAEGVRVRGAADADTPPAQARQAAQERAFAEAVFQAAQSMLPRPLPDDRTALLRQHLSMQAQGLVLSFQEIVPAKTVPAQSVPAVAVPAQAQPLTLELDVVVDRQALGDRLLRLGLLAGPAHPRSFALRLGPGVAESDLAQLSPLLGLQGLARLGPGAPAAVQVSLERVEPGGYLKAVLRQGQLALAADGRDLAQLWLDLWGRYFSLRELQPGDGAAPLAVSGFGRVDELLEFTRVLLSWDDSVREVYLRAADIRSSGSAGLWTFRVTSQERLDARLREHLPARGLAAVPAGGPAQ